MTSAATPRFAHRAPGTVDAGEERLRAMIATHGAAVRQHLARVGVAHADVDDCAQEVFLVAALKEAQIAAGCERAFLVATAHRIAGNVRRGSRRRGRTLEELVLAPGDAPLTPEALTGQLGARGFVADALESLPGVERVAVVLYELSGLSIPEIGARLGVAEGTVASRLRRARERLREWALRLDADQTFRGVHGAPLPTKGPAHGDALAACDPELLSWWIRGGEVDALRALVSVYERKHPSLSVVSAAAGGQTSARQLLRARLTSGRPPDTFLANGGQDLASWVNSRGFGERMEPLGFLFGAEAWGRVFPADILDMVSHGGRVYAVPLDIHRTNSLYFNRAVFDRLGLSPPTTLEELHTVSETMRDAGQVPLALGTRHPWTLTMLAFENVMVSDAGGEYYQAFFAGRRSPFDAELARTLAHVTRILGYANTDAPRLTWDGAVDRVRTGAAAMTIAGDWAKGYLTHRGCKVGEDFGELPMPGAAGAFVFALDVFGMPRGAPHPAGAIDLLKAFGSREGQDAFSLVKGSIPARLDVDLARYDAVTQARIQQFHAGPRFPSLASMAPSCFTRALEGAMSAFARSGEAREVIDVVRAHYDLLSA